VLSAVYRSHITPALTGLPPALRHEAGESLSGTIAVAEELGPQGAALLEPAKQAFLQGMHVTALCCAAVTLFGAVMVLIWLPGKGKGARAKASAAEAVPESAAS